MLCNSEIKKYIESEDINISPYEDDSLEPASYDLKIGRALVAGKGIIDPHKEKAIIRTGEWAEIESLEIIGLSQNIAATYGIRSSITRQGIIWFGGPQIDPGYKGKLFVSIFNPTSEPFEICFRDPFFTVMFYDFKEPASNVYDGKFQNSFQFPEEDVERMLKLKGPTLSDVVASVGILEKAVADLTRHTDKMSNNLSWIKTILIAILIAMVVAISSAWAIKFIC